MVKLAFEGSGVEYGVLPLGRPSRQESGVDQFPCLQPRERRYPETQRCADRRDIVVVWPL
jgi:hypothetical protein